MPMPHADGRPRPPLRLWPGVVAALLILFTNFVLPAVAPDAVAYGALGAAVASLAIVVWWAFASRAPLAERWGAILLMPAVVFVTSRFIHKSIAGAGMGMLFYFMVISTQCVALVAWAVVTRNLAETTRRVSLVATIVIASGAWTLVRTEGIRGTGSDFHWRWTPTAEERLLAQAAGEPAAPRPAPKPAEAPRETPVASPGREPLPSPTPSAAVARKA